MMPVSWHHVATVLASLGLLGSSATVQMDSQGTTVLRMWMNVRATLAKVSTRIVLIESMAIPATVHRGLEERLVRIM